MRLVKDGMLPVNLLLFKRRYLSFLRLLNCVVMLPASHGLLDKSAHLSSVRAVRVGTLPDKKLLFTLRWNRFVKLLN